MGAKEVMEATQSEADAILRRAAFRLVPLILAMYIASFLNRVNAGFAALTMNHDLGFSPEVYGWGVGAFFWGYLLFEVPSNLIMEKVGARLWLSRIMLTWALVSMANAFVRGPVSFFTVRFVLGLAEAGFYPGILLYFTYWFPAATRARILALFCMGIPISNIIGSPLSSWLLGLETGGLHGWICWKAYPPCCWASSCCGACRIPLPRPHGSALAKKRSCWRGWRKIPKAKCMGWVRCSGIGGYGR
jgi:ACS family tartrate transporter-like MFS transporter